MLPREKLRGEAYRKIGEFLRQIKPLKPRAAILYGSYARGDFTELSDIDVCLIAENLPENIFERRSLSGLYRVQGLRAVGYYPQEFLEELRKPNFFIYDVLSDGVAIYNDGFIEEAKRVFGEVAGKLRIARGRGKWVWMPC